MSELDQLYQEFYEQVTTKIWADYEDFKKAKTAYFAKAQVEEFQYLLLTISGNFSRSFEDPEVNKTNYQVTAWNTFRDTLIKRFDYYKKKICKENPVQNFLEERLKKIIIETQYSFIVPSQEVLSKTFAFYDAYIDIYAQLKNQLDKENSFPIMSIKQTLRQWLANGENERVVEALQTIADQFGDKYFVNDVTPIAGRFNSIKRDRQNGVISDEFYNIQLNQIRQALQDLIENVPANATLPDVALDAPTPTPLSDSNPTTLPQPETLPAEHSKKQPADTNANIPWIIGLVLLIGATLLAAIIPCPSSFLSNATQILLAIGAAGVATILPGLFSIDVQGVKAGSAIGVFALVYLVNPAKSIENNSACDKAPFEFTISLQADKSLKLSNQYPKLENATLQIRLMNKWEDALIDANGDADFKNIAGDYKNQKVGVRLQAKYWKLERDSVLLVGKSQTLTITPTGELGMILGKVFNEEGNDFLENVLIEVAGEQDTTDMQGKFSLSIPLEKQREQYELTAIKKGYESTSQFVYPGSETIPIRLRKKK